ncbi:MAG: fatty acid desaturase [Parvularculaceae bacterium]|nr:fatty acid desaturase [Parvularculaceae bacterium]
MDGSASAYPAQDSGTAPPLPMAEARVISRRFTEPRPQTYWTDFILSAAIGWGAFAAAVAAPAWSAPQAALVLISSFALIRAVLFTHELAHLKKGTFGAFRFVWNLFVGMPFLVPSYSYTGVHIDHHRPGVYGSTRDGEYVSFGAGNPWKSVGYVLLSAVLPALLLVRFLILTPLSWIVRPLRDLIWRRMSSLAIDLNYDRHPQNKDDDTTWLIQETATTLLALSVAAAIWFGVLPMAVFYVWYAVTVTILTINALRTLGAHAYRYAGDVKVSKAEEYLDSINVPSNDLISRLIAPVGLRFHATHHLFPATPYHELPKLHAALVAELPDNTAYLSTSRKSFAHAFARLWREASEADRRPRAKGA